MTLCKKIISNFLWVRPLVLGVVLVPRCIFIIPIKQVFLHFFPVWEREHSQFKNSKWLMTICLMFAEKWKREWKREDGIPKIENYFLSLNIWKFIRQCHSNIWSLFDFDASITTNNCIQAIYHIFYMQKISRKQSRVVLVLATSYSSLQKNDRTHHPTLQSGTSEITYILSLHLDVNGAKGWSLITLFVTSQSEECETVCFA